LLSGHGCHALATPYSIENVIFDGEAKALDLYRTSFADLFGLLLCFYDRLSPAFVKSSKPFVGTFFTTESELPPVTYFRELQPKRV
jgi:hypothetical protein